jgi:hypothetical protein
VSHYSNWATQAYLTEVQITLIYIRCGQHFSWRNPDITYNGTGFYDEAFFLRTALFWVLTQWIVVIPYWTVSPLIRGQ